MEKKIIILQRVVQNNYHVEIVSKINIQELYVKDF